MYKFLVIQTAFTGDVVLATAIIEKIHKHYPEARIDFMLRKGNEGLLEGHPYLTKVWIWDKKKNKHINLLGLAVSIRKEKYTHIINPHRFPTSGFIMVVSGAGYTSGFDKNPFAPFFTKKSPHIIATGPMDNYTMETGRYQLLLEDITDKIPEQPRLHPTPAHYESVAALKHKPFITISPSSVWFTKRYPAERWIKLMELLPADHNLYILGGAGDKELGDTLVQATNRKDVYNKCGELNYLQSAALMQDALMNYANDSAPLHFAGAMNAPVTGVFCSTVSWLGFGPTHEGGRIVEIDYPLQCRPCGIHGRKSCPEGHFKCAYDIKDEQLLWWISKTI